MSTPKIQRCAIYTRKSSEEGLDQNFNSLHAQREATEAYIQSQVHEGWQLIPKHYDDGGFSGGTTDRPALKALLQDIQDKKIDVVVVYKVDRLSRSINDFAKMMDLFDQQGVSFVSITQHFNTTTAMGRLTLNVLLSFAQFEREVTGERIRDKIAASKRKGMWMGGPTPLGFDSVNGKLIPNIEEVVIIEKLYSHYMETGSATRTAKFLNAEGYRTKQRVSRHGKPLGGALFTQTSVYKILHSPLYIGHISHKGEVYPGQHEGIIDPDLWQAVQQRLSAKESARKRQRASSSASVPAPLRGLLFGPDGKAMTPTHSKKGDKRYRYYVTSTAHKKTHEDCPVKMVAAGDIEGIVFDQLKNVFKHPRLVVETWGKLKGSDLTLSEHQVLQHLQSIHEVWDHLFHTEQARLLQLFIEKLQLKKEGLSITLRTLGMNDLLREVQQFDKKVHAKKYKGKDNQ